MRSNLSQESIQCAILKDSEAGQESILYFLFSERPKHLSLELGVVVVKVGY